jgi:hypothetical protein
VKEVFQIIVAFIDNRRNRFDVLDFWCFKNNPMKISRLYLHNTHSNEQRNVTFSIPIVEDSQIGRTSAVHSPARKIDGRRRPRATPNLPH